MMDNNKPVWGLLWWSRGCMLPMQGAEFDPWLHPLGVCHPLCHLILQEVGFIFRIC